MESNINILVFLLGAVLLIILIIVIPIFLRKKIEDGRKWAFTSMIFVILIGILFYTMYSWFGITANIPLKDKIIKTLILTIKEIWFFFTILIVWIIAFVKTSRRKK